MGGNEAACRQDTFLCLIIGLFFLRNDQRELKGVGMAGLRIRIRIQEGKNDPHKQKKLRNFIF